MVWRLVLVSVWVDLAGANSRFISPAVREPTLTSCSSQQVYFCTSSNITVSIYQKCSELDTQVSFASSSCHHVTPWHGRAVASFSHPRAEAASSRESKQCCTVCCYRGWVTGLSTHLLVSTAIYYLLVDSIYYLLLVDII